MTKSLTTSSHNLSSVVAAPNETINITSLEFKSPGISRSMAATASSTTNTTKHLISPSNSLTLAPRPVILRQQTSYMLSKEATFPAISLQTKGVPPPMQTRVIESDSVGFVTTKPVVSVRHSMIDMRARQMGKDRAGVMGSSVVSVVNEPKLIEFNNFQIPVNNKTSQNRPLLIKRTSLPYQQLVKMSKTRNYGNI